MRCTYDGKRSLWLACEYLSCSKVYQIDLALLAYEDVLWLEVTVNDVLHVDLLKGFDQTSYLLDELRSIE